MKYIILLLLTLSIHFSFVEGLLTADIPVSIFLFGTVVVSVLSVVSNRHGFMKYKNYIKPNIFILLTLLIGFGYFSLIYTQAPNYGLYKISYFTLKVLVIIAALPFISENKTTFNKMFIVTFTLIIGLAIYKYSITVLNVTNLNRWGRFGANIDAVNPIFIGRYFGLATIFYLVTYIRSSIRSIKIITLVLLIISIQFVFVTGSKGPLFGLILCLIILVFMKYKNKPWKPLLFFGLLILLPYLISYVDIVNFFIKNDFLFFRYIETSGSYESRTGVISLTMEAYFKSHFIYQLFGHGSGGTVYLLNQIDAPNYPHNILVEILYEYGIAGLILFVTLLYKIIQPLIKSKQIYTDIELTQLWLVFIFLFLNSQVSGDLDSNAFLIAFLIILHSFGVGYQKPKLYPEKLSYQPIPNDQINSTRLAK